MVITWDYDPLFAAVLGDNQSLRGYYLHRARLKMCGTITNVHHFTYLKARQ